MAGTKRPQSVRQNAVTETVSVPVTAPQTYVVSTANSSDFNTLDNIRVNSLGGTNSASLFSSIDKSQGFFDINLKGLSVAGNLALTETPNGIVISTKNTNSITSTYLKNAVNLSNTGGRIYAGLDGQTINFRTINVGSNLTLQQTSDTITIGLDFVPPTGDVNGASNLGPSGAFGLYAGKVGDELQFRKIASANNFITLSNDSSGNQVIMTFNEGSINLANVLGTLPTSRITGLAAIATNPTYANLTNAPVIPTTLNDLSDVSGTPSTGQYLKYDGSSTGWVPAALTSQNAITNIKAGSSNIGATTSTTDVEFLAGSELQITGNVVNRTVSYQLKPTGITAGTYNNPQMQVDQWGRVIGITTGPTYGTSNYVDPLNVKGDLLVRGVSSTNRLPIGGSGQYLIVENGLPVWRPLTLPGTAGTVKSVTLFGTGAINVTGDPITTAGSYAIGLANSPVAAGTYTAATITVDQYGRVTAASNSSDAAKSVIAGNGLVGGGQLSQDITVDMETIGTYGEFTNPTIAVDEYGRVVQAYERGVVFEMVPASSIASLGDPINTVGKKPGKVVINSTTMTMMIATGTAANATWVGNGGSPIVTPV